MNEKITAPLVRSLKGKRKLTMLTAYDYPMAKMVDQSGVDMVLVGDSLAMVVLGREDTLSVTLEEMIHHCRPVSRAVEQALVVGDMPFLSYESGVEQAILNAGRMLKEGGVRAVKLEGAGRVLPQVRALVGAGIPVMGHIGLTPQRMAEMGGFKVQGKSVEAAEKLTAEALELAEAGCFSLVLEGMPAPLAKRITAATPVPTIGIGAGPHCDGQVLVTNDILGLYDRFVPKFVKQYAALSPLIAHALAEYKRDVESGKFPGMEHSFSLDPAVLEELK